MYLKEEAGEEIETIIFQFLYKFYTHFNISIQSLKEIDSYKTNLQKSVWNKETKLLLN